MKTIREDIKNGAYRRAYLLCGTQQYLKRQYRNKLREGVLDSGDGMNCSVFEGRGIDEAEVVRLAETLPFFAGFPDFLRERAVPQSPAGEKKGFSGRDYYGIMATDIIPALICVRPKRGQKHLQITRIRRREPVGTIMV